MILDPVANMNLKDARPTGVGSDGLGAYETSHGGIRQTVPQSSTVPVSSAVPGSTGTLSSGTAPPSGVLAAPLAGTGYVGRELHDLSSSTSAAVAAGVAHVPGVGGHGHGHGPGHGNTHGNTHMERQIVETTTTGETFVPTGAGTGAGAGHTAGPGVVGGNTTGQFLSKDE